SHGCEGDLEIFDCLTLSTHFSPASDLIITPMRSGFSLGSHINHEKWKETYRFEIRENQQLGQCISGMFVGATINQHPGPTKLKVTRGRMPSVIYLCKDPFLPPFLPTVRTEE